MIVKTLDGTEYNWKIPEKVAKGNRRKTSNLHQVAKSLLRKKYPNVDIYEEVPIITERRDRLYLDFYLPTFDLVIEVNGEQHYKFSLLFHENKLAFAKSKVNDTKKAMWCEINNIELVILKYDEIDQWEKQI